MGRGEVDQIMGKTWAKMVGAFTILGVLIGLAEWLDLHQDLKLLSRGLILGVMVVLLPAIWMWDSSYRQLKLERERKKLNLVQQLPDKKERLRELRLKIEELDLEMANIRIDMENQKKAAQSMFRNAPDWMMHSSTAVTEKKHNELFMKGQAFERVVVEEDRVSKLTDDEWRAEQVAKIYVPE